MSLIACTTHHNIPFVVGDILFSSEEGDRSKPLPSSVFDIHPYLENIKYKPTDYYQKIYVIKKNVCIALAGEYNEMKKFLEEFRIKCNYYDDMKFKDLMRILDDYDKRKLFSNSAFLATLVTRESISIEIKNVYYPLAFWKEENNDMFEKVLACGSGKEDFCFQSSQLGKFNANAKEGDVHRAISANIAFIAKLLATEMVSLHTIKNYWGAGFETIFYDGDCLRKLDEIVYVICQGQFDSNGDIGLPAPRLVLHYKYYKDILFYSCIEIRSFEISQHKETITIISKNAFNNLYVVPAIDLKEKIIEPPPSYSFSTNRVAIGYAIITQNNSIFSPSFFLESGEINVSYNEKESIQLSMPVEFIDIVRAESKKVYPNL